ncbi:MAG: ABC transporter substrate-binding protein [Coriobacteriaceae bacterium]|nr:ABC transporter substrate-binding protein [Coriobacteriaceae bacterium]
MAQSRERTRTWPAKTLTRRDFIDLAAAAGAGAACVAALGLVGCSGADDGEVANGEATSAAQTSGSDGDNPASAERPSWSNPEVGGNLVHTGSLDLAWATGFTVDLYEGDRALACIADGTRYLFVPAGDAPQGIAEDVTVLERPLSNIYLASSSTLCLFAALGAVDCVSHVSVTQETCTVEAFTQAIASGDIVYGGKYSAPDYEAFLNGGCRLAVENTMIYHTPEVREKLMQLGVPVIVEQSSLESAPLGRLEWIMLWGAMLDKVSAAQEVLDRQAQLIADVKARVAAKPLDCTVAFFYINANGAAVVRKPGDYVAKMIAMAGGTYAFAQLAGADENRSSSTTLEMEAFYAQAKDADVIIYNSTVAGRLKGLDELVALNPLLADFKAVKNRRAWCCEQNVYQQMTATGEVVVDLHEAIADTERDELTFFFRLT